jgi:peptidyl-tRNA hydrolase
MAKYDEKSRMRLYSWEHSGGAKIVVKAKDLKEMLVIQGKLK